MMVVVARLRASLAEFCCKHAGLGTHTQSHICVSHSPNGISRSVSPSLRNRSSSALSKSSTQLYPALSWSRRSPSSSSFVSPRQYMRNRTTSSSMSDESVTACHVLETRGAVTRRVRMGRWTRICSRCRKHFGGHANRRCVINHNYCMEDFGPWRTTFGVRVYASERVTSGESVKETKSTVCYYVKDCSTFNGHVRDSDSDT
ncbi:hypothetical protein B0H12DRAFT_418034 [Mycena haematopus]|nr:hypothetical protein B0H12DRAFT_418034 [Mycena haematopus]